MRCSSRSAELFGVMEAHLGAPSRTVAKSVWLQFLARAAHFGSGFPSSPLYFYHRLQQPWR